MNDAQVTANPKQQIIAGAIGNILEWYDFAVFGYFAWVIGAHFFPSADPLASLIKAYGVFAAGYLMRPAGGVIFGYIGDCLGRKKALQLSVLMMAIPTTLLGLLPTYEQIGVTASVLMIFLRLVQGVSVGGELIGSIAFVTEISPPNRRGFRGSWTMFSALGGIMLGSLAATVAHGLVDHATLVAWGWRVPFLAGIVVGGFGMWMRKGMVESPEFLRLNKTEGVAKNPLLETIRQMPGRIAHVSALVVVLGGGFYMLFVWWPTYLNQIVSPPVPHALLVNTISMLVLMTLIPVCGWLSDVLGGRVVIGTALVGLILAAYPLFWWTDHGLFLPALFSQLIFAVLMSGILGPIPAVMVDMFPPRTRFSGIAIGYNVALAVFGGTAPVVSTLLVSRTGAIASPSYYLILMAFVSLLAVVFWHRRT